MKTSVLARRHVIANATDMSWNDDTLVQRDTSNNQEIDNTTFMGPSPSRPSPLLKLAHDVMISGLAPINLEPSDGLYVTLRKFLTCRWPIRILVKSFRMPYV
ncbi:hypothetical protein HAX54_036272 [Datura stramonium]|uniref:Uncharacterized protein n=1 Tax=Datura stramonium TaxID=4076 RepID=A0ABS8VJW9_DATST|nr:hypothetical protein [Datura stramonium]